MVCARHFNAPIEDCIYGRKPTQGIVIGQLERATDRIDFEEAAPGDILVFWIYRRNYDQHLGIKTDKGFIHTYANAGFVTENSWHPFWEKRLMAVYRFRGIH